MPDSILKQPNWSVLAVLGILIIMVVVAFTQLPDNTKDPRSFDNKDPKETGCEKGAKTLGDPVPVMLPDGSEFGQLHARYSERCGTIWGTVFTTEPKPEGYQKIVIASVRRKDKEWTNFATSAYDDNPSGGRIWGDMLGITKELGCVEISAQVFQNDEFGPVATTGCVTIK